MGGIMIPITMSAGMRAAQRDNQADARFDLEQEASQMALDEAKANQPLLDMKRKSEMAAETAKYLAPRLSLVRDEDIPSLAAQFFTDFPVGGRVEVRDGKLFDQSDGSSLPMDRDSFKTLLAHFSDPEKVLEMQMAEMQPRQYVVDGQVVTMTPQKAAQVPGARAFTDVSAGVTLGKARSEMDENDAQALKYRSEADWIGPKALADIAQSQASAASSQASADKTRAEIGGVRTDLDDKKKKALRDETDFILKQLKIASGTDTGLAGLSFDAAGPDERRNMLATLGHMSKNPAGQYSQPEQQAATKALLNLEELGYIAVEPPSVSLGSSMRGPVTDEVRTAPGPDQPPVAGAKQAKDGNWYVQQNGQWFRVKQ